MSLRLDLAVTDVKGGKMVPRKRTSSSDWWLPTMTHGRAVERYSLPETISKDTPVARRIVYLNERAVRY